MDTPELKQSVYYAYPSDQDGGCRLNFSSQLSINSQSEQKSCAWAFLSYLLSSAYQQSVYYLPVSDAVLQEQFAQLQAEEKVTQADIDTFYALVDHAQSPTIRPSPSSRSSKRRWQRISMARLTKKTTAERIQSRASLYLMEQKVQ